MSDRADLVGHRAATPYRQLYAYVRKADLDAAPPRRGRRVTSSSHVAPPALRPRRVLIADLVACSAAWAVVLASAGDDRGTNVALVIALTALTMVIWSVVGVRQHCLGPTRAVAWRTMLDASAFTVLTVVSLDAVTGAHVGGGRSVLGSALAAVFAFAGRSVLDRTSLTRGASAPEPVLLAGDDRDDLLELLGDRSLEIIGCVGPCRDVARRRHVPWSRSGENLADLADEWG
jgi:hypothetical protein